MYGGSKHDGQSRELLHTQANEASPGGRRGKGLYQLHLVRAALQEEPGEYPGLGADLLRVLSPDGQAAGAVVQAM